jgi:pyridoxal phosphate-dependent aminotransferase EpsN
VDAFEREFAAAVGSPHAAAVSSGTAALHLALILAGVGPGDEVLASTLTFAATVNPIVYLGGRPILIDSEPDSWNLDPALVLETLRARARRGKLPKAVVVAHLYGQSADIDPIRDACNEHGVALIEDAAEALGATYKSRAPGTFGMMGVYSFNGNKIITTSGGGMLVSEDAALIAHARKLATQARDPAPHYEHTEVGYNYRMSNILAAIGRAQLEVLTERVEKRRRNFEYYEKELGALPGIRFMPEAPWGRHTRWLTCLTIDPGAFGCGRDRIREHLEKANIEARPIWKPMHLQPVFRDCEVVGGRVSEEIFENGLCLPSGSALTTEDLSRVVEHVREARRAAR